ncbi:jg11102 [Pararge aegeria aegeria]|uniref:Jg11102 protein n=2 Tax=Pararge aegeria TaxID=116150 RepID=A0A8S4SD01_9NEOP|nr:jg11102 [Pararge aegeria aegeria]
MLKIIIVASVISVVCGTQYAYFDNNLVEFDDPPAPTISLPYPYKEPKVIKVEPRPAVTYDVGVRTAIVSSPPTAMTKLDLIMAPVRLICSVATSVIGFIKRTIMYVITSIPALVFGCFSSLGVCNLSAICKFFNIDPSSYVNEIASLVNPERLKRATQFVETAINKYRELQKV